MEEQLISFETANLAKEKGLNITSNNSCYNDSGIICETGLYDNELDLDYDIPAPTQSLLQKWLREFHSIHLVVRPRFKGDLNNPIVDYSYNGEKGDRNNIFYPTYEEALEKGLQEALKLINK